MRLAACWILCFLVLTMQSNSFGNDTLNELMPLSEVEVKLREYSNAFLKLDKWILVFRRDRELREHPKGMIPEPPSMFETAKIGNDWYLREVTGRESQCVVYKDNISLHKTGRNQLDIYGEPHASLIQDFQFTDALFLNIYGDLEFKSRAAIKLLGGRSIDEIRPNYFLPDAVAENRAKYNVEDDDVVDGFPCFVIEWSDQDKIWIDKLHGFVRRREVKLNSIPRFEYVNQDFFSPAIGIWLPRKSIKKSYNLPGKNSSSVDRHNPEVRYQDTLTFVSFQLGNFQVDRFDVSVVKDGQVNDFIRGVNYELATNVGSELELKATKFAPSYPLFWNKLNLIILLLVIIVIGWSTMRLISLLRLKSRSK